MEAAPYLAALTSSQTGVLVAWSVLSAVVGLLAYMVSDRFGRSKGVTPWRVPSLAWAVIALVSFAVLPVVLLVLPVACLTTPAAGGRQRPGGARGESRDADAMASEARRPGRRQEPGVAPHLDREPAMASSGSTSPTMVPEVRDLPLFGWYRDPSGRHQLRYWDGRFWTEHVRDDDVRGIDPPI